MRSNNVKILLYVYCKFKEEKTMMNIYAEWKFKAREVTITGHGLSFLCMVGLHVNGAFAAIINFGVSAELSEYPDEIGYNSSQIVAALRQSNSKGWLPSNKTTLKELAHDLACVFDTIIRQLKDTD